MLSKVNIMIMNAGKMNEYETTKNVSSKHISNEVFPAMINAAGQINMEMATHLK